jgi:DNA-binding transcriptional LysR family regulator
MTQLLLRGIGITVLPTLAVWSELERGDLVEIRLTDAELPSYEVALVAWPGHDLSPAAEAFITITRSVQIRALLSGRI